MGRLKYINHLLTPILPALNVSTSKCVKFLVSLLRHLLSNEFTLKDSFEFAKMM